MFNEEFVYNFVSNKTGIDLEKGKIAVTSTIEAIQLLIQKEGVIDLSPFGFPGAVARPAVFPVIT
ncbi:hypothetical protein [Aneurinibacillus terranovensis]|uniref:hypothetical protein n=1 Tax=Aneurinibacillus terranovensis TaxID=278991 RepID=UPI00041A40BC|nr:hypothetical protein [Aneurinibacillus terranovensis]